MNEQTYLEQQIEPMGENSFMKKLLKKRLNQKGLTLIELLAVIVILAIIAAIAIPAIANLIQTQRDKAVLADGSSILSAAKLADAAGACDLTAPDAGNECDEDNDRFTSYVGEVRDPEAGTAAYNVVQNAGGELELTYNAFTLIDDDSEYNVDTASASETANTITEAELNALMSN